MVGCRGASTGKDGVAWLVLVAIIGIIGGAKFDLMTLAPLGGIMGTILGGAVETGGRALFGGGGSGAAAAAAACC